MPGAFVQNSAEMSFNLISIERRVKKSQALAAETLAYAAFAFSISSTKRAKR